MRIAQVAPLYESVPPQGYGGAPAPGNGQAQPGPWQGGPGYGYPPGGAGNGGVGNGGVGNGAGYGGAPGYPPPPVAGWGRPEPGRSLLCTTEVGRDPRPSGPWLRSSSACARAVTSS